MTTTCPGSGGSTEMMDNTVSAAFCVPFFGPLPPYFIHWVKSCEINQEHFHWFVYSDQVRSRSSLNRAVTMIPYSLDEMVSDFKRYLDMEIPKWGGRKVCDYDPMFYFIRRHREPLDHFDFIGYTDLDVIYGELGCFLPENTQKYGLISGDDDRPCGPLTLIKRKLLPRLRESSIVRDYITYPACTDFDETVNLLRIFSNDHPVFCRTFSLQPAMSRGFNKRKNFSVWENGKVTVWDNRGHRREGGFHHFSRFKGKRRFRVRPGAIAAPAWGVCKFGILPVTSRRAFLPLVASLFI